MIEEFAPQAKTLIYADPPYFDKGRDLYLNAFSREDHERLAVTLNGVRSAKWILTYDDKAEIAALYADRQKRRIDVGYSLSVARRARELLITSDGLRMPL